MILGALVHNRSPLASGILKQVHPEGGSEIHAIHRLVIWDLNEIGAIKFGTRAFTSNSRSRNRWLHCMVPLPTLVQTFVVIKGVACYNAFPNGKRCQNLLPTTKTNTSSSHNVTHFCCQSPCSTVANT